MRILLTGYADLEAVEASINESEVFRYLMKPCPTEELKDAVRLAVQAAKVSELAGVDELAAVPEEELVKIELIDVPEEAFHAEAEVSHAQTETAVEAIELETLAEVGFDTDAGTIQPRPFSATTFEASDEIGSEIVFEATPAELADPIATSDYSSDLSDVDEALQGALLDADQTDSATVKQPDPEVLVLTQDADLLEGVTLAIGPQYAVRDADSIETALRALSEYPVGVLITDLAVNESQIDELTRTLKREVPELVTIIASERSDAALLIGLINHGQIFRFLLKPLQIAQTRIWLNSAMAKYAELCANSNTVLRHRVVHNASVEAANSGLFANVRARIKTIKERFASSLLSNLTGARGE